MLINPYVFGTGGGEPPGDGGLENPNPWEYVFANWAEAVVVKASLEPAPYVVSDWAEIDYV